MNHLYFTTLESSAAWGAQAATALAGPPGDPTRSWHTRHPMRVFAELADWQEHPAEALSAMLAPTRPDARRRARRHRGLTACAQGCES